MSDEDSVERADRDDVEHRSLSGAGSAGSGKKARTGPLQFLREVRGELRRVAWPTRRVVVSYSVVVLVTVVVMTLFVFALDQAFGQLVLGLFG